MPILKIIFDICLLRGRPQDLPASWNLFWLCALGSVVTGYASAAYVEGPSLAGLLHVVLHEAIFGGAVWVLLKTRNHPERWLQSIVALYAVGALFSLVTLPVLPQLTEFAKHAFETIQQGAAMPEGAAMPVGGVVLFVFTIAVWHLLVMAQVLHHAMELSFGLSALIGIFTVVAVSIVEIVFISIFSVPVSA